MVHESVSSVLSHSAKSYLVPIMCKNSSVYHSKSFRHTLPTSDTLTLLRGLPRASPAPFIPSTREDGCERNTALGFGHHSGRKGTGDLVLAGALSGPEVPSPRLSVTPAISLGMESDSYSREISAQSL